MRRSAVAAALVGLEGLGAVAAGLTFAVAAVVGHPHDRATAVVLGVLLASYGAGMLLIARGLSRRRPWARTPALLVQFFALIVAWYQRQTLPVVTAVVGVVAVAAAVAVLRDRPEAPAG